MKNLDEDSIQYEKYYLELREAFDKIDQKFNHKKKIQFNFIK